MRKSSYIFDHPAEIIMTNYYEFHLEENENISKDLNKQINKDILIFH